MIARRHARGDATPTSTITGQVLDNLSGVAAAQFRIDGGALQALALDADGRFSITTALALDGTRRRRAHRHRAGHATPPATPARASAASFTLDTRRRR